MFISDVSFNGLVVVNIGEINPETKKRPVTINDPYNKEFVSQFTPRGVEVCLTQDRIDNLGISVGSKVDYSRTDYFFRPSEKEDIKKDDSLEKGVKEFLVEACDSSNSSLDEAMVVVSEVVSRTQEQAPQNTSQSQDDGQGQSL